MLHDYVLHPIFKDEPDSNDLKQVYKKLDQIKKEIENEQKKQQKQQK